MTSVLLDSKLFQEFQGFLEFLQNGVGQVVSLYHRSSSSKHLNPSEYSFWFETAFRHSIFDESLDCHYRITTFKKLLHSKHTMHYVQMLHDYWNHIILAVGQMSSKVTNPPHHWAWTISKTSLPLHHPV